MTPDDAPLDIAGQISAGITAIHEESYGEPVQSISTYLLDDVVLCVLDVKLLVHERTLLDHEQGSASILRIRKTYQEAVGASFKAVVERTTGRRVIGFISDTHLKPPFTIELFRLAAHTDPPPED